LKMEGIRARWAERLLTGGWVCGRLVAERDRRYRRGRMHALLRGDLLSCGESDALKR
jgi:hypothetical protein